MLAAVAAVVQAAEVLDVQASSTRTSSSPWSGNCAHVNVLCAAVQAGQPGLAGELGRPAAAHALWLLVLVAANRGQLHKQHNADDKASSSRTSVSCGAAMTEQGLSILCLGMLTDLHEAYALSCAHAVWNALVSNMAGRRCCWCMGVALPLITMLTCI